MPRRSGIEGSDHVDVYCLVIGAISGEDQGKRLDVLEFLELVAEDIRASSVSC